VTDRILVRDVLVRAKEEKERRVLSPYPEPMASISAQERALLSHAVPDAAGTRRVVIEQTEGGEAVLLGLRPARCFCAGVSAGTITPFTHWKIEPLPKENHDV
jgi:hypothetical protein